jgi:hypothetical protein
VCEYLRPAQTNAIELERRVKAEEWSDAGYSHDILWLEADAVRAAQAQLAESF